MVNKAEEGMKTEPGIERDAAQHSVLLTEMIKRIQFTLWEM